MSPTKASLARFHPSLLPRAKSAELPRPVTNGSNGTVLQSPVIAGGTKVIAHVAGTASDRLEVEMNGMEKRLLATPKRRSRAPGEGNMSEKQSHFVMNSGVRASPPQEADDESMPAGITNGLHQVPDEEVADNGNTGINEIPDGQKPQNPSTPTQRKPWVPTSGMGIGEDGEPSLPSTPSQLGLEPPLEKPKGLHFSTPIRRSRRKRRLNSKSSPLKSPNATFEHPNQKQKPLIVSLGPRRYIANTPRPPRLLEEVRLLELQKKLADVGKQLQEIEDKVLQQLLVSSWQGEGSKEGRYMAKRAKDVIQRSKNVMHLRDEVLHIQATQNYDLGHSRQEETDRKVASLKPSSLTQRLANFLPFALRTPPSELRPPSPKSTELSQVLELDTLQTAAVPFATFTSNTLLLSPTVDNDLLQRQNVNMSTPQRLLTCDLEITVNVTTQQTSHLDVQKLSSWAEPELGLWLRKSCKEMDLPALGRAFGHYWEAAKLRGECWISCKRDFQDLVANPPESDSPHVYYGMQDLVLARSNVQLKVSWHISISDQGEVESHSSAYPRFPAAWQQEVNSELSSIGDAFKLLVEDRGVSDAIGTICKVVFPTKGNY